ncbi:MAG: family 16 glycoside hydrolase, partial [Bryobacteraceae bacterium]
MKQLVAVPLILFTLTGPGFSQKSASPFVGRWNFNITMPTSTRAAWLGISEKNGALEVWYQPTGGNVYQIRDFKVNGSHLTLAVSGASAKHAATTWELDAAGTKLTGILKRGADTIPLTGLRAPALKRPIPKMWTKPEPMFNGRNLDGWEPIGNPADSHWTVKDGLLVNEAKGTNLRTAKRFNDF